MIYLLLAGRFRAQLYVVYFGDLLSRDRFYKKALHLDREEIEMGIEIPIRETEVDPGEEPIPAYHPEPTKEPIKEPAPAEESAEPEKVPA
jgi:hypothetical protein